MKLIRRLFGRSEHYENAVAMSKGEEFGRHLCDKVDAFAEERLDVIVANLLEVFKGQLDKIHDDPKHPPEAVAEVELEIFKEEIATAQKRMWEEVQEHIAPEIHVAEQLGGLNELIAEVIEGATEPRLQILIAGAKTLYETKMEEIRRKT